jgi:hypothetical protein
MTLDPRLSAFRTALLAALGLSPFVACGGSTSNDPGGPEEAGSGPEATGGRATPTGGVPALGGGPASGGVSSGGVSSGGRGGRGGTGGAPPVVGGKANAGAGGMATAGSPPVTGGRAPVGGEAGMGGATRTFECLPPTTARPAGGTTSIVAPKPEPFVECDGGWRHRPVAQECPSQLPRNDEIPAGGGADGCTSDADCSERPHGWCATARELNSQDNNNRCSYGCVSDADCADGTICECGSLIGKCVQSDCTTDADCYGLLCASYIDSPGCNFPAFACQTPEDKCMIDADCDAGQRCSIRDGFRECMGEMCAAGRPFLVGGEVRTAELAPRRDWLAELEPPCLDGLSEATRGELAAAWTQIGLLEHASVAAFARFSLELLSFGAPADLVAKSAQAMSDETDHARKAFALASAYAAAPRGPGVLSVAGELLASRLEDSVVTAFVEGCIGETVAALEAREAADRATDPTVRAVLSRLSEEEGRHALLAYEFVKWALSRCPARLGQELAALLDQALARAAEARDAKSEPGPVEHELVAHGILPESRRRALRCAVLAEVVEPCVRTLLGGALSGARPRSSSNTAPYRR